MKKRIFTAIFSAAAMFVMILDAQTSLQSAQDGISLCIRVVIPSLFPLFVFSMLLTDSLRGFSGKLLSKICSLCGMPDEAHSILIPALMGGYPVGAQAVYQSYGDGFLTEQQAKRLLAFCSNAGPAFIFGIAASQFDQSWCGWILWLISLLSALIVGFLFPGKSKIEPPAKAIPSLSIQTALSRSIRVMASVCGWIIIFRVIIGFAQRWFLWMLPDPLSTVLVCMLELSNGCCQLRLIENPGLRLIITSGALSLGGLCVAMQTAAVTRELGIRTYLLGKVMQTVFSIFLAYIAQRMFFTSAERMELSQAVQLTITIILAAVAIVVHRWKNNSSIPALSGV